VCGYGGVSWINIAVCGGRVSIACLCVPSITVHAMQHSRVRHPCQRRNSQGTGLEPQAPHGHRIFVAIVSLNHGPWESSQAAE